MLGIISETMFMKTVSESKIVTPEKVSVRLKAILSLKINHQARIQTFEGGGAKVQEFMNSIYPEGYIVT